MRKSQLGGAVISVRSILIALALIASNAQAQTAPFNAIPTHISDGDSFKSRRGNREIEIRLASIDAPELHQPMGFECKNRLKNLIENRQIEVRPITIDRYHRIVGEVRVRNVNINRAMVRSGCAWAYRRYLHDNQMIGQEALARREKLGIWALPAAQRIPPWRYRK